MEYFRKSAVMAMVGLLATTVTFTSAEAGVKSKKHQTITMEAGTKTGLQEVFVWDNRCRTVRAKFKPLSSKNGRLYKVRARSRISKRADRNCAGKSVRGYRVVFKPHRKFKGATVVKYQITAKTLADTFVYSRKMIVR